MPWSVFKMLCCFNWPPGSAGSCESTAQITWPPRCGLPVLFGPPSFLFLCYLEDFDLYPHSFEIALKDAGYRSNSAASGCLRVTNLRSMWTPLHQLPHSRFFDLTLSVHAIGKPLRRGGSLSRALSRARVWPASGRDSRPEETRCVSARDAPGHGTHPLRDSIPGWVAGVLTPARLRIEFRPGPVM